MSFEHWSSSHESATSRFRIVCRTADGSIGLVTLCQTLAEARIQARREVDQHLVRLRTKAIEVLLDPQRPRQLWIEQWIGSATMGSWLTVERNRGGYQFMFHPSRRRTPNNASRRSDVRSDQVQRSNSPASPSETVPPRCGDMVACLLLPKRSRKGGWFAQIVGLPVSGPVTGAPADANALAPGKQMMLRVCSCKLQTQSAQLAWPSM